MQFIFTVDLYGFQTCPAPHYGTGPSILTCNLNKVSVQNRDFLSCISLTLNAGLSQPYITAWFSSLQNKNKMVSQTLSNDLGSNVDLFKSSPPENRGYIMHAIYY